MRQERFAYLGYVCPGFQAVLLVLTLIITACGTTSSPSAVEETPVQTPPSPTTETLSPESSATPLPTSTPVDPATRSRRAMVDYQIRSRNVDDEAVLAAMINVPRHKFVPADYQAQAYNDHPLPIGYGQTISQPFIVALMTQLIDIQPGERVLEIGTGSGYQAAVLAEITDDVYTIEIIRTGHSRPTNV